MKSELNLGVLFTGKIDSSFDSVIKKIQNSLGQLQGATAKVTAAQKQQQQGTLSLQKSTQSYIKDVEKLLQIQARWYGAKTLLFAAVELPFDALKKGLDFFIQVDAAEAKIRRYDAMMGDMSNTARSAAHDMILLARQLNLKYATPFDDIVKGADRLIAAGVEAKLVMGGLLEEFVKFQTAWPEIEMDKFTKAVVGMVNTFRNMPGMKELSSDLERYKAVLDKVTVAMGVGVMEPQDLPKVMQHFGQMSQSIALSVDEMLSLSVLVTNLGSKASTASRALRGLAASLVQEDKLKLFKQLGIEIDRNLPLGKQLINILDQIREKVTGSGEQGISVGAQTILGKLTSVERVGPLIALIRDMDSYKKILDQVRNATGANDRAAKAMNETFAAQWKRMGELVKEIGAAAFSFDGMSDAVLGTLGVLRLLGLVVLGLTTILKGFSLTYKSAIWTIAAGWESVKTRSLKPFEDMGNLINEQQAAIVRQHNESYALLMGDKLPNQPQKMPSRPKKKDPDDDLFVPPKVEKIKNVFPALIASQKAIASAYLEIQKISDSAQLKLLENVHKLGLLSDDKYYTQKLNLLRASLIKEKEIIANEWDVTSEMHDRQIETADNADDKKKATKAKEADEMRMLQKVAALDAKMQGDIDDSITQRKLTNIAIIKQARDFMFAQEAIIRTKNFDSEVFNAEQLRSLNDWLYSQKLKKSNEYYTSERESIKKNRDTILANLKQEYDAFVERNNKAIRDEETSETKRQDLRDAAKLKEQKYYADVTKANNEYTSNVEANRRKEYEDVEKLFSDEGILGVVDKSLEGLTLDLEQYGNRWKSFTETIASGMSDAFETFFTDALKLQFQSIGDYFNLLMGGIQKAIATFLAEETTKYFLKMFKVGLQMAFGGTTAGSPGQLDLPDMTANVAHSGGLFGSSSFEKRNVSSMLFANAPRLHNGLRPDEFPAILQAGETVTPKGGFAGPKVEVNIQNETGSPVGKGDVKIDFDMDKMVVGIILKNIAQNGPLRGLMGRA